MAHAVATGGAGAEFARAEGEAAGEPAGPVIDPRPDHRDGHTGTLAERPHTVGTQVRLRPRHLIDTVKYHS